MLAPEDQVERLTGNPVIVPVMHRNTASGQLEETEVEVREVTMKSLRAFSSACAPFFAEFDEAGRLGERLNKETGDREQPDAFALFKVLADYSDEFMLAASLVSNKSVGFYSALHPDQFFNVASAVVKVNGDFFVRNLAPALLKTAKALGTIGSTTSKS